MRRREGGALKSTSISETRFQSAGTIRGSNDYSECDSGSGQNWWQKKGSWLTDWSLLLNLVFSSQHQSVSFETKARTGKKERMEESSWCRTEQSNLKCNALLSTASALLCLCLVTKLEFFFQHCTCDTEHKHRQSAQSAQQRGDMKMKSSIHE